MYSQADVAKFSSRTEFANAVVLGFGRNNNVIQWCCCLEDHEDGGKHYHLAIKLEKKQRWINVKKFLLQTYNISIHFSSVHHNYFSAWQYVTKSDLDYEQSDGHPDLTNAEAPQTDSASVVTSQLREESDSEGDGSFDKTCRKRKKRLSALQVSEIIHAKSIKTQTELFALAQEQKHNGKCDLSEFIMNRQPKAIAHILKTTWDMSNAQAKLDRSRKTRIELLIEAAQGGCIEGCEGRWLACAQEVLVTNGIQVRDFGAAVYTLLEKGRGKYRNIMLIGPANCGKTFLLKPLEVIYHLFTNPATGTFAWVGVQDSECIFLNDFRWSAKIIPWHDLLLLLEGEPVHFPAPKTHFAEDVLFTADTPVFATSKNRLAYVTCGVIEERETEMMSVRWNIFTLSTQIPEDQQIEMKPCPRCFASLICMACE
jgi:hypothetical protein